MRQILCQECAEEHLPAGTRCVLERGEGEPAEFQRLIFGLARKPNPSTHVMIVNDAVFPLDPNFYICDGCNAAIKSGEPCAAWSVWTELQQPQPSWEGQYLEMSEGDA